MRAEVLRLENVSQQIDGEYFLKDINMHILKGEIVGFLTPEAKGKKELIQMLERNIPITYGKVYMNGQMVNSYAHSDLSYNKVYVIGQKSTLVSDLNIAENLFVLRRGFKKNVINKKVLRNQTERLMKEFGLKLNPDMIVMRLKPIDRCMVELIRAYLMGCILIVLDNCNSFLGEEDISLLQNMVKEFCQRDIAFLYMGNHHEEIYKICHRAILFANGQIKKKFFENELDDEHINPYITRFGASTNRKSQNDWEEIIKMDNIYYQNLKGFYLSVRKGECVTLLVNDQNVSNDILELMTEGQLPDSGQIILNGTLYTAKMSRNFLSYGVGVIEENPAHTMIFPELSVLENLAFLVDRKIDRFVIKNRYYDSVMKEYQPYMGNVFREKDVTKLKMEDLYRLVYYRIHLYHPEVVFCLSPFAHGDMQCRQVVLQMIQQLKKIDIAVIILQVNISDAMAISDRLLVLHEGKIAKTYDKEEFYLIQR